MPTRRPFRPVLAGAAGLGLLVSLSACSQELASADVGDCMDSSSLEGAVVDLPTVACDEAHDAQVVGTFDLEGAAFPGEEEVGREATERCAAEFEQFVGIAVDRSTLTLKFLGPNAQTWEADNGRQVICFALTSDGSTVTESWEGAEL